MVSGVLVKVGSTVRDREILYKKVVQEVLIYGNESWVITGKMTKVLEGLHN